MRKLPFVLSGHSKWLAVAQGWVYFQSLINEWLFSNCWVLHNYLFPTLWLIDGEVHSINKERMMVGCHTNLPPLFSPKGHQ